MLVGAASFASSRVGMRWSSKVPLKDPRPSMRSAVRESARAFFAGSLQTRWGATYLKFARSKR